MPRATPLPPEERRRAILDAAIPLVRERGFDVATADIAAAAGVAEGTLFRVFATKADLVHAIVDDVLDPATDIARLDAIDRSLPLADRVRLVAEQWAERIGEVSVLMGTLATTGRDARHGPGHRYGKRGGHHSAELNAAVARVLEPDAARLRVPPERAAAFIRSALFSAHHPMLSGAGPLTTDTLVDLLLHGVAADPDQTPEHPC